MHMFLIYAMLLNNLHQLTFICMQDSIKVQELQKKLDVALRVIQDLSKASPSGTGQTTPSPATRTSSVAPSSVSGKGTPSSVSGNGAPAVAKAAAKSLAKGKGKAKDAPTPDTPVSQLQIMVTCVEGSFKPCLKKYMTYTLDVFGFSICCPQAQ